MSKTLKLVLVVALGLLLGAVVGLWLVGSNQQPVSPAVGGDNTRFPNSTVGVKALKIGLTGTAGTELTRLYKGTCTLVAGTGGSGIDASHAASTTKPYDCAVTGAASGDVVLAGFASTTAPSGYGFGVVQGWDIVSAGASSTADYITVLITNRTGTDRVPSAMGIGSSTAYLLVR